MALAGALGCPYEVKRIVHRPGGAVLELLGGEHLLGVDTEQSDALTGPWPDMVLLAHQSNETVARWIRRQSGGKTRLVLLGRPWAPVETFDLVVTTPQYQLSDAANVLHNLLPLHGVTSGRLAEAAERWAPRLTHLPRPFVTVLVGGSSGPYVFDEAAAARLGREASALARSLGGSLLVSTSARTKPAAVDALFAAIDVPSYQHRWTAGDRQNPYLGFLGLADRLIVTADSISMIAEAVATGRPVADVRLRQRQRADARGWPDRAGSRLGRPHSRLALRALHELSARPAESQPRSADRASGPARRRQGRVARRARGGQRRCGWWATR